jgi:hypothetical protein
MSGLQEFPADQSSEFIFGMIALALLSTVAIALALIFPDGAPIQIVLGL